MELHLNLAHLHLLLNHIPVLGTIIGVCLFLVSFVGKNQDLRRSSFLIFTGVAVMTVPTFISGFGAMSSIKNEPNVSSALLERHEGSALLSLWFMELTGALAVLALWQTHRKTRPAGRTILAILVVSLLSVGLMARTGNTGGDIRHPEVWENKDHPGQEGTLGSILSHFEPRHQNFVDAMVLSKFETAGFMALHFIGLTLVIGLVGAFNLRILGFAKQVPIGPLHNFMPWALAGVGINVTTGMLAFMGTPGYYTFDAGMWLKLLALMLVAANAAGFYLSGVFGTAALVKAGEDAPRPAKIFAATSMFLWLIVILMGRYIQSLEGTVQQ